MVLRPEQGLVLMLPVNVYQLLAQETEERDAGQAAINATNTLSSGVQFPAHQ